MFTLVCSICIAFTLTANAFPDTQGYLNPQTIMMGGYYGIPPFRYLNFPFRNKEALPVAAAEEYEDEKESVTKVAAVVLDEEKDFKEQSTLKSGNIDSSSNSEEAIVPKKIVPKKTKSKPVPDDEDSFGSASPFGSGSFYNTFFPVMVGGKSGVRRKSGEDDGSSGGATAIANSFSTGKGGVASSHATSFGNVYLSSALTNGNERIRKNI